MKRQMTMPLVSEALVSFASSIFLQRCHSNCKSSDACLLGGVDYNISRDVNNPFRLSLKLIYRSYRPASSNRSSPCMIVLGSCDVGRQRVRSAGASESSIKEPTYFGGCTSVFVQTEWMVGDLSIHRNFIIFMPLVRFVWFCMIFYVLVPSVQSNLEQNMPGATQQPGFPVRLRGSYWKRDQDDWDRSQQIVTLWRSYGDGTSFWMFLRCVVFDYFWFPYFDVWQHLFRVFWYLYEYVWMLVSPIGFQVPRATCYSCGFASASCFQPVTLECELRDRQNGWNR